MVRRSSQRRRLVFVVASVGLLACSGGAGHEPMGSASSALVTSVGTYDYDFGTYEPFVTHVQFAAAGLCYGLSDGLFGSYDAGGAYTFFGSGRRGTDATCNGIPPSPTTVQGAFGMTGTFPTGSTRGTFTGLANGGSPYFTYGAGLAYGWSFDRDYAGGGQVVPFSTPTVSKGLLMPYHGEYHWPGSTACADAPPCFYGAVGLAVSLDGAASFTSVGQILQPREALSTAIAADETVGVMFGSPVLADVNGKGVPGASTYCADSTSSPDLYLYVFYQDSDGVTKCGANNACTTVARAPFCSVVATATAAAGTTPVSANDALDVSVLFKKYDPSSSLGEFGEPGTGGMPDLSVPGGNFAPLFTDWTGYDASVIYDSFTGGFVMVHIGAVPGASPATINTEELKIRTAANLVGWSDVVTTYSRGPGTTALYPTITGETGNPLTGGAAPQVFFVTFSKVDAASYAFPSWDNSEIDSIPLDITYIPPSPPPRCHGTTCT
jgi:hypothetical protein